MNKITQILMLKQPTIADVGWDWIASFVKEASCYSWRRRGSDQWVVRIANVVIYLRQIKPKQERGCVRISITRTSTMA